MPDPASQDQSVDLSNVTILFPGEQPQGTQDTATGAGVASPGGDDEHRRAALEAAGVKVPPPTTTAAPTEVSPELLASLKTLDVTKLPADVREILDRNFHADYTRKTQALAEERRVLESQRNELSTRLARVEGMVSGRLGGSPDGGEDAALAALQEKALSGDRDAFEAYMTERESRLSKTIEKRLSPIERSEALRRAYEVADANEPLVRQNAEEVGKMIAADPEIGNAVMAENYRFAPLLFRGLARIAEADKVMANVQKLVSDGITKGIDAYIARVKGLPATTSLAGTTSTTSATPRPPAKTDAEAHANLMDDLRKMGVI